MILTEEQEIFVSHPDEVFVEACPGAGKTQTVVARLAKLATTLPPRKGVAVLSFTNKAVEEFQIRSGSENVSYMLRHPGFIGTFDGFVRHFLFSPGGIDGSHVKPRVIDSWDSLDDTEIRLRGSQKFAGPGVSLDKFDPETNVIDPSTISHVGLRSHVLANIESYQHTATTTRRRLNNLGFYTANEAGIIALKRIRNEEWGSALGKALGGRFQEIIVDEAQDCNQRDLEILTWLRSYGIRITTVCDMNQSIYEFRDGGREHLLAFSETYGDANKLKLTGNFRSTPPICMLAATLKTTFEVDTSLARVEATTHPIAIIPYLGRKAPASIGEWFISYAGSGAISEPIGISNLIVLAHSSKTAKQAAGNYVESSNGTSKVERLARIVGEFWSATTGQSRKRALNSAEKWLLDLTGLRENNEPSDLTLQRIGYNERVWRRKTLSLVMQMPRNCLNTPADRTKWVEIARTTIQNLEIPLPEGQSIRSALVNPPSDSWVSHLENAETSSGLHHSTIHNAKGGQYPGVCVVIPPDDSRAFTTKLLQAWEDKSDFEPKRVIYVGVTRAQKLLAIAIPNGALNQCVSILDKSNVPYVLPLQDSLLS